MSNQILRTDFGTMGREAKKKLRTDNDIKVIIQGQNSQTGIGKTTLAIQLCRYIDPEWNAEDKAFIDIHEYLNAHLDYPKGSALLLDEIEHGADSRRAMSSENVDLSQGWAKLRARNIATVATLPSISMLDKRMLELADYWVLVKNRGIAQPFRINVNDFRPSRLPSRKPLPGDEHIQFRDLPADDEDKAYLDELKDEAIRHAGSMETIKMSEHKDRLKKELKEAKREFRNEVIEELYKETSLSSRDIAKFEWCDVNQQTVSSIVPSGIDKTDPNREARDAAVRELYERTDMSMREIADVIGMSQPHVSQTVNS